MTEELYLCVHVPEFPAQALLRLRAELRGSAVAVMEGAAPLEKVCSVNRHAAGMGVRQGMTKAELDSFEELVVLRRSAEEERVTKAAVMEMAGAFTPRVEDLTAGPHGTDGAFVVALDGSGTERLFGPVKRMTWRLMGALRELGLAARVAVSGNLLTAVVVARSLDTGRIKVARSGESAAVLAGLPVAVLKLTEEQAETFAAWGIRTVGELAALDETELVVRMGQEGGWLRLLARGCAEHLMVPVEAGLVLEEVMEFDAPVEGMESLIFVLGPMLDQLIGRAGNRALELASVRVEMGLEARGGEEGDDGSAYTGKHVRVIKPALPTADRLLYLKLLHLDLEAHPPGAGVKRMRVTAVAGGRAKVQTGLFSPPMPEAGRLEVTLARLAGLVGESWVGTARMRDSHAPESFAMEKFRLPEMSEVRRTGHGRARQDRVRWQAAELERRQRQVQVQRRKQKQEQEQQQKQIQGSFAPLRMTTKEASKTAAYAERIDAAVRATTAVASIRTVRVTELQAAAVTPLRTDAGEKEATKGEPGKRSFVEEETERVPSNVLSFAVMRPDAPVRTAGPEQWGGGTVEGSRYLDEEDGEAGDVELKGSVLVRRMRPPVPIRWKGGEEFAFWMEGVLYEVRERYGPWRRSGAWWTGQVWSQEEWDMTVEAGCGVRLLCVLTHDLLRDRWHMEAVYD